METWRKELYHHGIKGQRWGGVRRYQNYNGSLTSVGKTRYAHTTKKQHLQRAKDDALNALMFMGGSIGLNIAVSSAQEFIPLGHETVKSILGLAGGIGSMSLKATALGYAVSAGYNYMKS